MKLLPLFTTILFSANIFANVGGSDLQNFNPTSGGLDFITVHPSRTLKPGQFNFGSFFTYTTNSLSYSTISSAPNNQTFTEPNDRLLYSNLHLGVGIMKGWDIGFSAGFINSQDIKESNFLFSYGDTGINDIRLHTKVRLYDKNDFGLAAIASVDFDQIKNNPFVGDGAGPVINVEGAADLFLTSKLLWAVNLGYRIRQPGRAIPNTGVIPLSNQWIYSTAMSYTTDDKGSALIGELYGSFPVEQTTTPTDRDLSNLEFLLGYRWRGLKNIDLHGGLGTEAFQGLGSPDIRVYLGLNWRLNFLVSETHYDSEVSTDTASNDSDKDGVPDPIDQCPDSWKLSTVDEKGCPIEQQPNVSKQLDSDSDGIVNDLDQCPNSPARAVINNYGCEIKNELIE